MSVLTYLVERASEAVLSDAEKRSINTSIATLRTRLTSYFGQGVYEQFQFGSSTRGTILPRQMAVAGAECNTVIELKQAQHDAFPPLLS